MSAIVTAITTAVTSALTAAINTGKSVREALAESLEEAAAKLRDGGLLPDEALERAKTDQDLLSRTRDKFED